MSSSWYGRWDGCRYRQGPRERHQKRKPIGRARVDPKIEDAIRASLASGNGYWVFPVRMCRRTCRRGASWFGGHRLSLTITREEAGKCLETLVPDGAGGATL